MEQPLVSVIVPMYNAQNTIPPLRGKHLRPVLPEPGDPFAQ